MLMLDLIFRMHIEFVDSCDREMRRNCPSLRPHFSKVEDTSTNRKIIKDLSRGNVVEKEDRITALVKRRKPKGSANCLHNHDWNLLHHLVVLIVSAETITLVDLTVLKVVLEGTLLVE